MAELAKQLLHLKKEKMLKKVIGKTGPISLKKSTDLYLSLMRAIVGQQLSVKAAATIWSRFLILFKNNYPEPKKVLKLSDEVLRSVGLSYQKAGYLKNIANFALKNTMDYKQLRQMPDEDLIEYLVSIKGVGRWTVEMILMFNLNRENIFPKDDLGIQNGMISLYDIKYNSKKELHIAMDKIAENWKPYRTLACLYIWRYKDS